MKVVYAILFLFILGCNSNNEINKIEINETDTNIDSIINQSKQNLVIVDKASREGDSSISKKVEKTAKQINNLQATVQQLKRENNELKVKVDDHDDLGKPFQLLPVSGGQDNR